MDSQILNRIIRKALEKGGDFADVYLENRISRRILLEESKFKSAVFGISQGAGVRVIAGDKTGYAYTDDITEENLLRAAEVARYVAEGSTSSVPIDIQKSERRSFISNAIPLENLVDEKRLAVMQRAHQAALDYDARIKMASISYYDEIRGRAIEAARRVTGG